MSFPPSAAAAPNPALAAPAPAHGAPGPVQTAPAAAYAAPGTVLAGPSVAAPAAAGVGAASAAGTDAARATAAAATTAAAAAAAAPGTSGDPGPETASPFTGPPSHENGRGARRRARRARLVRLRIGSHLISRQALRHLVPTGHPTGLIVGTDRFQQPVPVRFFRPEPTRISLVGEVRTGQLFVFRALALGARVVVVTPEPDVWHQFAQRAGEGGGRLVVTGTAPPQLAATAAQPCLVVYDFGVTGPAPQPPLGRWQTQLTLLRRLGRPGIPVLQDSHLVMLQRLADSDMAAAATALRLTGQHSQLLQVMSDDMLALLGGGTDRYVWLAPTAVEHACIAASTR